MSTIKNPAPIMVSVYNREFHFKQCIESLQECEYAQESHLFIAIDAPYREQDIEANSRIIEYSKSIKGFKEVTLFIRPKNVGVNINRTLARNEIFKQYDRLIMFEDDNIFAKDFLFFLNSGLETYKDKKDIFCISGYNFPIQTPSSYSENVYLWKCYSAWGVGVWREKMQVVELETTKALSIIRRFFKNIPKVLKLNAIANHYVPALLLMLKQNKIHGDGYISLYLSVNQMYTVFPTVSRVRNTGHDGSGFIDAMEDDIYIRQEIYKGNLDYVFPKDIKPNREIEGILKEHFKQSPLAQCKNLFKMILTNFGFINKTQ